jgi:hypothetical protein
MGAAMAQEAFMNWDQMQVSWNQFRDKYVRQWFRVNGDSGKRLGQSNAQPRAFHPDDRGKRVEFSLHIGC